MITSVMTPYSLSVVRRISRRRSPTFYRRAGLNDRIDIFNGIPLSLCLGTGNAFFVSVKQEPWNWKVEQA